ncbi:hypothetical protein AcV7_000653 [Taiwanofungus camphoratus]|nr:hypothetical protein AcV7_000653 [Antrodia cinnamomea]
MFFTPELLERRDSGFGLLWLAATLGAKSSFKKLPKRSVLTADISQLCDLIAEPVEPLALRLSSNLMIGVARVYKVKQEIFLTDVTTCFNSLKKAVQEFHTLSSSAELQMGQPSLRSDALTLIADPGVAFAMDFDNIFVDWEENLKETFGSDMEELDDEFDPAAKKIKRKQKARQRPPSSLIENLRANPHTLDEHHEHLLSGSFDASFNEFGFGGVMPSSSQYEPRFGFSDDIFGLSEGMDLEGEIGDELARELGEGWGGSPVKRRHDEMDVNPFGFGQDHGGPGVDPHIEEHQPTENDGVRSTPLNEIAEPVLDSNQDAFAPNGSVIVPLSPYSPIRDPNTNDQTESHKPPQKKGKRVRLLLDARTELTDDELKTARANYMEAQDMLRHEMAQKKLEKESVKLLAEMIWGVPQGVQAPVLVDFWLENFRIQVEARSGALYLESSGQPPTKRRKIGDLQDDPRIEEDVETVLGARRIGDKGMDIDMNYMTGGDDFGEFQNASRGMDWEPESRQRSSEEPGQARRASRPPSLLGSHLDLDPRIAQDFMSGSQRSAFFPWDNAGASSSVNGASFDFGRESSAKRSFGRADVGLRGSFLGSRPESPLNPGRPLDSPTDFGTRNPQSGDNFVFEVPDEDSVLVESQRSDMNILTLERNSFNFLEYAKMQLKTFPSPTSTLTFDDVVPTLTSTPHVAAAAFYHCLVLATKDLVNVTQERPYGTLKITVK